MHEIALLAATKWAEAHAPVSKNPAEFGAKVVLAYWTAALVSRNGLGVTSALSEALSIPAEVQQAIELLTSHLQGRPEGLKQTGSTGAGASV